MRHPAVTWSLLLGAMLAAPTWAEPPVTSATLRVPEGRIHAVTALRASGGTPVHLLLLTDEATSEGAPRKQCHVFPPTGTPQPYASAPAYSRPLPLAAVLVAPGDVNGDGREDFTYLTHAGVFAFLATSAGLAEAATPVLAGDVLVPAASDRLAAGNYLADVNGDGLLDVLLPVAEGLSLHTQDRSDTFAAQPFALLHFPTISRLYDGAEQTWLAYRLPHVVVDDFDGNGLTDVAAMDLTGSHRFLQVREGTFERVRLAGDLAPDAGNSFTTGFFGDWNGDKHPDVALTRMEQRRAVDSTVRVYMGDGGPLPPQPTTTIAAASTIMMPIFLDATGDGLSELLLYKVHFGLRFALNYFLRNRILVDVAVHRLDGTGGYKPEPDLEHHISVAAFDTGAEPVRAVGDFNGDGMADIAVGLDREALGIFLGDRQRILDRRPSWTIGVEAYGTASVLDLNADGRDDVVIRYPEEERYGRVSVILSQRNLVTTPVALLDSTYR